VRTAYQRKKIHIGVEKKGTCYAKNSYKGKHGGGKVEYIGAEAKEDDENRS